MAQDMHKNFFVADEETMLKFGSNLSKITESPTIIFFHGQLGAGKTTLVRGFLRALGYQGNVKSPTYTLVESYEFPNQKIFHFDFYRLQDPSELEYMGIQDYLTNNAICLIEWPENGLERLPSPDLSCYIEPHEEGRAVEVRALTPRGENMLARLEL